MSPEWQQVINLAMSGALIIFGVGSWAERRKSGESTNAADVKRLEERVGEIEGDVKTKVGWKDYNSQRVTERERVDLLLKPITERVDRMERKVFNGGHRG